MTAGGGVELPAMPAAIDNAMNGAIKEARLGVEVDNGGAAAVDEVVGGGGGGGVELET